MPRSATAMPAVSGSEPGRMMIIMPRNPTPIAVQRRQPTCSPSSGRDSATTSKRPEGEDRMRRGKADQVKGQDGDADLERQHHAAHDLQRRLAAPHALGEPRPPEQEQADGAERPVAPHGDEDRRVVRRQRLGQPVLQGEDHGARQHEGDAAQVALLRSRHGCAYAGAPLWRQAPISQTGSPCDGSAGPVVDPRARCAICSSMQPPQPGDPA